MKVKLIFEDWQQAGKSIYNTELGLDLSMRDFHSGAVFDAELKLDPSDEQEIRDAFNEHKAYPVFSIEPDNNQRLSLEKDFVD